jgi:hypothetical protein
MSFGSKEFRHFSVKDFLQHFLHQGLQGVRFVPEKGFHSSETTALLLSGHGGIVS